MTPSENDLLPCPFCGGRPEVKANIRNRFPRMGGPKPEDLEVVSVQITHNCKREQDELGNFPILASHIEFRGRDHKSAWDAWNRRAA